MNTKLQLTRDLKIRLYNIETGKIRNFKNAETATKSLRLEQNTFVYLRARPKNYLLKGKYFWLRPNFEFDIEKELQGKMSVYPGVKGGGAKRVEAFNIDSNVTRQFDSGTECAKTLVVAKENVTMLVRNNLKRALSNTAWQVRYVNGKEKFIKDRFQLIKNTGTTYGGTVLVMTGFGKGDVEITETTMQELVDGKLATRSHLTRMLQHATPEKPYGVTSMIKNAPPVVVYFGSLTKTNEAKVKRELKKLMNRVGLYSVRTKKLIISGYSSTALLECQASYMNCKTLAKGKVGKHSLFPDGVTICSIEYK